MKLHIVSEFWLIGGCWNGRLMLWTSPNDTNNFTVLGKCRVGHRKDILCIDISSQFIVSGGVDGILAVWNIFSGTLKYAIELPPPQVLGDKGTQLIKPFNHLE